jgi:hypothetical protein
MTTLNLSTETKTTTISKMEVIARLEELVVMGEQLNSMIKTWGDVLENANTLPMAA